MYAGVGPCIPQPLPSPGRGCTPAGSRSGWRSPRRCIWVPKGVSLISQPGASDILIPFPQGSGAPFLHSSSQLAQGISHSELPDSQDPSPAHAGILVLCGFIAVPVSKMPISASHLQPTPPECPLDSSLRSLKASEPREGLQGPMREETPSRWWTLQARPSVVL